MNFLFKTIIALLPLITATLIVVFITLQSVTSEMELKKVIKATTKSMIDAKVSDSVKEQKKKRTFPLVFIFLILKTSIY